MARIVTKFKYLKPNRKQSAGGYVKYIATREGVEKIDDSKKFAPVTVKQQELIGKLIKDFPSSSVKNFSLSIGSLWHSDLSSFIK